MSRCLATFSTAKDGVTNLGSSSAPDRTDDGVRRPVRRRSTLRRWLPAVLLIVVLVLAGAAWLATGLLGAARDLQTSATGAQSALQRFGSALQSGEQEQARDHLASARAHLADADAAAQRAPVRVAAVVPVLGGAVDDVDRLLRASHLGADAAEVATDLYDEIGGSAADLFTGVEVDIPVLRDATAEVERIDGLLADAEAELVAVRADLPGMAALADARDRALTRLRELRGHIAELRPLLAALPAALGVDGRQGSTGQPRHPAQPGGTVRERRFEVVAEQR